MAQQTQHILLAEDDEHTAELIRHVLEHEGYTLTHVADGRAAIEYIDNNTPPEIMLLDITMPYADGHQVLKHLRNSANWQQIPVIMVTDHAQKESVIQSLKEGASDYVTKPFDPQDFLLKISHQLQKSSLATNSGASDQA